MRKQSSRPVTKQLTRYPFRMNNEQAAFYLGIAEYTLRHSRSSGMLCGKSAPKFIKLGRMAQYKKVELDKFLAQFKTFQNTSQYE